MQSQDDLNDVIAALRKLAEQDAGREAPWEVETRMLAAFRRQKTQRRWRNSLTWSLAAAAMIAVLVLAGLRQQAPPAPGIAPAQSVPPPQRVATRPPQLAVASLPQVESTVASTSVTSGTAPVKARRPTLPRPAPPRNLQTREIVTEFFPLLDVAPPFERGELLRVTVPASTMRKVGLPVNQDRLGDRIYADVLVGQEGLARAIRFVSYE
jgi:hypothetical protein